MKKLKKFISCVAATALAATSLLGGASFSASADDLITNGGPYEGDGEFIESFTSGFSQQTTFELQFKYDVVGTPSAPQPGEPDVGYNDTFEFLVFDTNFGGWNRTTVGPRGYDQTEAITPVEEQIYTVSVPVSVIFSKLSTGGTPYGINIQTGAQLGTSKVSIISLKTVSGGEQKPFTVTGEWTKGTASKMTVDPAGAATVNANINNIEVYSFDLSAWSNPTVDVTVKYETAQSNVQAEIMLPTGKMDEDGHEIYEPVNPYYLSVAAGTTNTYTTEIPNITSKFIAAYDGGTVTEIHVYNNTEGNVPTSVTGQTATTIAGNMHLAWNLGNSLEVVDEDGNVDEGAINPITTKKLIQAVKNAGFNTIKLPVSFLNMIGDDYTVNDAYMARIKEVISYAYDMGMYVVLNLHNDGRPTIKNYWINISQTSEAFKPTLDKFRALWTDIAFNLQEFDQKLIFQAASELMNDEADYGVGPTADEIANINSLNQAFVNAVRSAGGDNNTERVLAVVNYRSDIEFIDGFELPEDSTPDRLMISFDYYIPTDFTVMEPGTNYWDPNGQYGTKFMDTQFEAMTGLGIPVLIGEYGPMFKNNIANVAQYDYYVNYYAAKYNIVTAYWDNGETGYGGTALFDRINNELTADGKTILAQIIAGYGKPTP